MSISLAALRKQRGISQKDLAEKVGYAAPTISNLENGQYAASEELIDKLSKVLNVSEAEIKQAINTSRAKALGHGAPISESARAHIITEDAPPYGEREISEQVPAGEAGIERIKELIVELAMELATATPLMRKIGFQTMIQYGLELKKRLDAQGPAPRIHDDRGIPLSSKLAADLREGAKRGAALAERELNEREELSPSGKADEPSGSKLSPQPGTGGHHKGQRSSPAPVPKSHGGSDEGQKK